MLSLTLPPRTAPTMDELDRLFRRTVQNVRAGFPELLTRGFEVSQLYQQIIPYRTNRRELDFDSNEEYELALMQLLAGLRGYLNGDAELQKAMRQELASPNPDLAAFRVFATATVSLSPDAVRALDKRSAAGSASEGVAPSAMSPSEQVVLAGRATEAVDVTGELPLAAPSAAAPAPARTYAPALDAPRPTVRRTTPSLPLDAAMTAPRTAPNPVAAGEACRYCSGALPEGRRVTFCPCCGHNLTVQHCPACSTELEVGWKFCITCGREVGK
jgi:hypothetical protein